MNSSLKVCLLDDKDIGLHQIKNSFPSGIKYSLIYFSTFSEFQKSEENFDILFLDYFLDKDGITSDTIIDDVRPRTKILIGFSSVDSCNQKNIAKGADYGVVKVWSDQNEILENLFLEIL